MPPAASPEFKTSRTDWVLALLIAFLTCALYFKSGQNGFVWYDDPDYLTENSMVNGGFSLAGLRWAFSEAHAANWHPLTWLSHMLDSQLFGLEPRGHHLMSVGIHALNALLCFVVLRAATGMRWASAVCAALFALHPLRVQSVAWASERKDLLAGLFFFLCLWSYIRYARKPSKGAYAWVALSLALGLMCKPMLVSVPLILLLFDYWPLGRLSTQAPRTLLLEKLPLLGLVLFSIVATLLAQDEGGAFGFAESLPLAGRLPHAASSVLQYVQSSFWPTDLACFYPHPALVDANWNPWLGAILPLGLGLLWLLALKRLQRCCPELVFGSLWMLIMLLPVIGIVQVGEQSWADRYAYLPTIGLYITVIWPLAKLARDKRVLRLPLSALAVIAIAAAGFRSAQELPHWKSSTSLAQRALAVTENNYVAHLALGNELLGRGDLAGAQEHIDAAALIRPKSTDLALALSSLYVAQGKHEQALELYRETLAIHPNWLLMRMRLGIALAKSGRHQAAIQELELARSDHPDNIDLIFNLAQAYLAGGQAKAALPLLDTCLERSDKFFDARIARGEAHFQLGNYPAAKRNLLRGARIAPEKAAARLALLLASAPDDELRDGEQALLWAIKALQLNPGADALEALAAAQAEVGRFDDAQQTQLQAIEALPKRERAQAQARLSIYRERRPYRLAP